MCSNNTKKTPVIKCPHCNAQYLPGEIFMPGAFLGRSEDIVKDSFGKIIYEDYQPGREPSMVEHYLCDYCDSPFTVEASITYKASAEAPENDFKQQYVSLID